MNARELYNKLDKDFILDGITDEWENYVSHIKTQIIDTYNNTSMGLMLDYTDEINKVYTAVFLTDEIIHKAIKGGPNSLIFVHHPMIEYYDENYNFIDEKISIKSVELLKENKTSVYNLHIPLDNYSKYSTGNTLADALGLTIEKPFALYNNAMTGCICSSDFSDINDLTCKMKDTLKHEVKLYDYGQQSIKDKKIAVLAGFGNDIDVANEMLELNVHTLITGVSHKAGHLKELHEFEKDSKINVLGGTHYSTEKFAMIKMCEYFKELEIEAEFIAQEPCLFDL